MQNQSQGLSECSLVHLSTLYHGERDETSVLARLTPGRFVEWRKVPTRNLRVMWLVVALLRTLPIHSRSTLRHL